jgi:hypothetical protein
MSHFFPQINLLTSLPGGLTPAPDSIREGNLHPIPSRAEADKLLAYSTTSRQLPQSKTSVCYASLTLSYFQSLHVYSPSILLSCVSRRGANSLFSSLLYLPSILMDSLKISVEPPSQNLGFHHLAFLVE